MRGLNTFIADLRNCRTKDEEEKRVNKELANIRLKFKDSSLSLQKKRKYICKLIYINNLGYEVDFGFIESMSLISSHKYNEKQVVSKRFFSLNLPYTVPYIRDIWV